MTRTEAEMTVHNLLRYELRSLLRKAQGKACIYCGCDFVPLTLEHVIPLSRGGDEYRADNVRLACMHCNGAKGSETLRQFLRWLDYVKYEFRGSPSICWRVLGIDK